MEAADVAHEHHENGEHKNVAEKLPLKATLDYYFRPKDQNSLDNFITIEKKDKKKKRKQPEPTESAEKEKESDEQPAESLSESGEKKVPLRQKKIQQFLAEEKKADDKKDTDAKEPAESPSKKKKGNE